MSGRRAKAARQEQTLRVRRYLRAFVVELRRILKRRAPEQYALFPKMKRPCHSCAFNPATDSWRGADATAVALMRAIATDSPFYCHEPMERVADGWRFDPERAELCAGYAVVAGDPATKLAFTRGVLGPDVPDDVALTIDHLVRQRMQAMP